MVPVGSTHLPGGGSAGERRSGHSRVPVIGSAWVGRARGGAPPRRRSCPVLLAPGKVHLPSPGRGCGARGYGLVAAARARLRPILARATRPPAAPHRPRTPGDTAWQLAASLETHCTGHRDDHATTERDPTPGSIRRASRVRAESTTQRAQRLIPGDTEEMVLQKFHSARQMNIENQNDVKTLR